MESEGDFALQALMGVLTFLMESPHWSHMNQGILALLMFCAAPPCTARPLQMQNPCSNRVCNYQ